MEQLSSIDTTFINNESPDTPMHISSISVYDPSTAPEGKVRFKEIIERYEDAIYETPMLRRRLVEVPGNIDFPYWIEDPSFDIEFHVRHIALPQPGDWRQFYIQVARLHSRGIDMQRPLWEVYVIEGLNNLEGIPAGSFAVMQKLHHAAVDGDAVQRIFMALHDFEPKVRKLRNERPTLIRETAPGRTPLMFKSWQTAVGRPVKLSKALVRAFQGMRKVEDARKEGDIGAEESPPRTRFNGDISPHRIVTAVRFDFEEFKSLRHAVKGATINDLAISILGGALNRYLASKDEPTHEALIAQVPVNIRAEQEKDEEGNRIAAINVSSCSDIEDPIARLQAIHDSTQSGKKRLQVMGINLMEDVADAMGPQLAQALYSLMTSAPKVQALANLMPSGPNFAFSNMPGPPVPVYLGGAQLIWGIGLGPVMPDMGLFITGTSSLGKFVFGITACRDMMPDPEFFQQCIRDSYDESRQALAPLAKKNAPKRKPKAKAKSKAKAKRKAPAKKK